jgi:hypothetical protein
VASGFLYVPDLDRSDPCYDISKQYIPRNATRQANLPPTDFTLIAIAPWINVDCTLSYLRSARGDPSRAFIFYLPDNSTDLPPSSSSHIWDLDDGGAWRKKNMYPVFAIPGDLGGQLMIELSRYSGNMTTVPYGHEISELPGIDPRDYVRMYTEIDTTNLSTLPSFWVMILVVVAVLVSILALTSGCMHLTQKRRRNSLRHRVESGDVNLEALGIKRFTIPREILDLLPVFVYNGENIHQPGLSSAISFRDPEESKSSGTRVKEQVLEEASGSKRGSNRSTVDSGIVISQETVIITDPTDPDVALPHKFLPYAQPTCPICLDEFVSELTEIKELPCGHIYHPECIDAFLGTNSSLCPLCKQCALPPGHCPVRISNAMVRKERNLRRLRQSEADDPEAALGSQGTWNRVKTIGSKFKSKGNSMSAQEFSTLGDPIRSPTTATYPAFPQATSSTNGPSPAPQSREDFVAERIRELAARQTPIQDPDSQSRHARAKWRTHVSRVFPGFQ